MKLEYKTLKEKVKEYNKKQAKFYGNMFAKLTKLEPHESKVSKFYPFLGLTVMSILELALLLKYDLSLICRSQKLRKLSL